MAILLTGGAGYIGSHCYYALSDTVGCEELVVLDDYSTGKRNLLPKAAICYKGSVGDAERLAEIFSGHSIDTVIHFAGSIIVSESVRKPGKYYRNNSFNSLVLLEACVRNNVKSFIFSSTASVYGNETGKPCDEDDPPSPENPYAASKLVTEGFLRDFHHAYGLNYTSLRYFNVAGADDRLRCGQVAQEATHLIRAACQAGLGIKDHIPIYGTDYSTPDGTCIRDYIHVTDLAASHVLVYKRLRSMSSQSVGETFNCGYGHGYSVKEVLDTFDQITGKTLHRIVCDRRPGDPESLVADPTKLMATTGWKPKINDLCKIVQSALDWEMKFSTKTDK